MTVSVCIPSVPPRAHMLPRALASVAGQTHLVDQIVVNIDNHGRGAAWSRDAALRSATSDWVAFLDDDDEFLPEHIEHLLERAVATRADMVYPWFEVVGGSDPFPHNFGRQWTLEDPFQTTITFLVRREAALAVDGFQAEAPDNTIGEDFQFVLRLARAGYRIEHLAERTWRWHHHGQNLSGQSWRTAA